MNYFVFVVLKMFLELIIVHNLFPGVTRFPISIGYCTVGRLAFFYSGHSDTGETNYMNHDFIPFRCTCARAVVLWMLGLLANLNLKLAPDFAIQL